MRLRSVRHTCQAVLLAACSALLTAGVEVKACYHAAAKPITDNIGRVQVIVDFTDDAHDKFLSDSPPPTRSAAKGGVDTKFFHQEKVLRLVEQFEKNYVVQRTGVTSWVGSSVTTYISRDSLDRLLSDPTVRGVTENESVALSSLWQDTSNNGEIWSWGRVALNGKSKLSNSSRRVYVIDGGVANHIDLPNVIQRVNVACGNTTAGCASAIEDYGYPSAKTFREVGCFGHATHVAGIIGAAANKVAGTAGVYAGVNIVSVAIGKAGNPFTTGYGSPLGSGAYGWCADRAPDKAGIGYGLAFAYFDTLYNGGGQVSIVNLSINPGGLGYRWNGDLSVYEPEVNNWKLNRLNQPSGSYPGAFVARSAGNQGVHSCSLYPADPPNTYAPYAYRVNPVLCGNSTDPPDGIMVVGAVNDTGAPVSASAPFAASVPANQATTENYSNYGQCVDIWAPGNSIVSSWGDLITAAPFSISTRVAGSYSNKIWLSGTSMAAPHVAGAAAYLADAYGLTTPGQIETMVRQNAWLFGYDSQWTPIYVAKLP